MYSCSMNPRVLELNDSNSCIFYRFLEVKKDGYWLVMFYAPWCAHCKRLEPIWSHVQQTLHNSGIRVCKMDCIAHRNSCYQFRIQTYPTIMFIKGEEAQYMYSGDRITKEIVHFALRVSNPPIRKFKDDDLINTLRKEDVIFFTYLGEPDGLLWDYYSEIAIKFQPHSYFYHSPPEIANKHFKEFGSPAVIVCKENNIYSFNEKEWDDNLNSSLIRWVNEERFPTFVKVTSMNINSLIDTNKYLVLAVVEESKVQEIPFHMKELFQFGWIGNPDLANSIAIMKVPLPYLLVLNSTTNHHHIPDDEPHQLTPEAVTLFLESIINQTAKVQIFIIFYNEKNIVTYNNNNLVALTEMWKGNPVLTAVIFGLPAGFLVLICYSIHCADILDAEDDDLDDDSGHEKKE
ncbi:hypothetical protein PGB90_005620 [Kerria lacca]